MPNARHDVFERDDYKDQILPLLNKSKIYNQLKSKCADRDSEVIALVDSAVGYACQRTKSILKHMGEFTLHDGDHLFRVLLLMERLISNKTVANLSSPELMLLILSAFFHDIGMAAEEADVLTWRKIWDRSPSLGPEEEQAFSEFKRFYAARPDQEEIIVSLLARGKNSEAEIQKSYLITDFIRQTHADRARAIIKKDWNGKIVFREIDLTTPFAQICFSHNEDATSVIDLDKDLLCGTDVIACLPLVGIILRLADLLDFDGKRTPNVLFSHLHIRHPVSLREWNKHRAVKAWEIGPERIRFSATCTHPAIEASIHQFCDLIDRELSACNSIIGELNDFNEKAGREVILKVPYRVDRRKIRTAEDINGEPIYLYKDTSFNLSKRQVIDLLMGTKLYGNPEVALRELLQNSIDACHLRAAQEDTWGNQYKPEITVKYITDGDETILEVDDNGTGMDQYIVDNYYTKIGSSFYTSSDFFDLRAESKASFTPTSRFGIGILSCFMIADTLIVDTKRLYGPHESSSPLNITVEGQDSIFWVKEGSRVIPGTTTKLVLRKSRDPWREMSEEDFMRSVETVSPNPPFTIKVLTNSKKRSRNHTSFLRMSTASLKDYSWKPNENILTFDITLANRKTGIIGFATVAGLARRGKPVERIELKARTVDIEGATYTLEKAIRLSQNSFQQAAKTITIDEDGDINEETSDTELARSKSRLSLHGIEVPTTLFPRSWEMRNNQVQIKWPFPMLLLIDVCGSRDLDLNSSRTEVILSDKWFSFEQELAFQVCSGIANQVRETFWSDLRKILLQSTISQPFRSAVLRIPVTK